ncbi:MAG: DUF262 domain-containing protein [Actinobacteria bacterium]|nr:DUF262 domain-containing protein [Actinomycetota bacterium]
METWKRTPLELFTLPQHFVIPLFQRPYVWEEEQQWVPLWKDIVRTVEKRIELPGSQAAHFLGAVVLQSSEPVPGSLNAWNVIDGQQRLTTLQLLIDAAQAALAAQGQDRLADKLEGLTHNQVHFVPPGSSSLKLRHLNKDRAAFDEVMDAPTPLIHDELEFSSERIVRAHRYFARAISDWLGDATEQSFLAKADQLTEVLQTGLQLVSINLSQAEDSQEIFETLNARGTPLTAADLVRNFVFQRLEQEGGDTKQAYERQWPFESKFWDTEVSVGRQLVSRSSLFLNQWLISKLGAEISPHSTFSAFKSYVEHGTNASMSDLLPRLKQQADAYEQWTAAAAKPDGNLSPVEMAFYRMRASGVELLKPLVLWLCDPATGADPQSIARAIQTAESWVYRRQLLRLSNSDLGRIVADIIRSGSTAPATELVDRITAQLSRLNVTSTYWPGDKELLAALRNEPVYRRYPRPRLRMFVEAIEDEFRRSTGEPQVRRGQLPIEHILPQKWQEAWPVESPEAEDARAAHVHRLGNLTLLTTSLNAKVSNGPWAEKREDFLKHSTINLTGRIVSRTQHEPWTETLIDERSEELAAALLRIWPVPATHTGVVVDPQAKAGDWIEIKHLVEAGLLSPGDVLTATHRDFQGLTATVGPDSRLEVQGLSFDTPSGAAKHFRQKATNGWYFWALPDGRRLHDLRSEFVSGRAGAAATAR